MTIEDFSYADRRFIALFLALSVIFGVSYMAVGVPFNGLWLMTMLFFGTAVARFILVAYRADNESMKA